MTKTGKVISDVYHLQESSLKETSTYIANLTVKSCFHLFENGFLHFTRSQIHLQ